MFFTNKKDLPPGQWHNEPDEVLDLVYFGLPALILRHSNMFTLNGYVGIPKTHPFWGKHYDNVNVQVHGGLTFANEGTQDWEHEHKLVDLSNFWVFGFDCGHSDDLTPAWMDMRRSSFKDATYKDINFVTEEVKNLARQLAEEKCSCGHSFHIHNFGVCNYFCDCGDFLRVDSVLNK